MISICRRRLLPDGSITCRPRSLEPPNKHGSVGRQQPLTSVLLCVVLICRGHIGDGWLSSSILFKYERSRGHLFVLSEARARRVALGSDVRGVVWRL